MLRPVAVIWWMLLLGALLTPSPAAAARKEVTAEEQYELGVKYLERGYYTKALEQFQRLRTHHRDSAFATKAELAIADLHFKKGEFDQARVAYEEFMRLHPRHEDLDYAVFRFGLTAFKKAPVVAARDQSWTRHAVNTWAGFETRFPSSKHQPEVDDRRTKGRERLARKELQIGRFYARRDAWAASNGRLEGLLRAYPDFSQKDRALASLAWNLLQVGEPDRAKEVAGVLAADFPGSTGTLWLGRRAPELLSP